MFDLHIHTNNSDGLDSWQTVLQKAEEAGLQLISITDHDNCDVYFQMQNPEKYFTGKILVGIEMQAYYKGLSIEILGYGFDIHKMRDHLQDLYIPFNELNLLVMDKVYAKLLSMGIIFAPNVKDSYDPAKHYFSADYLHSEMRKFPDNKRLIPDEASWERDNLFFRSHLANPNSPFYIEESDVVPPAEKIVEVIHKTGGKAVLPHVYQYNENADLILDGLLDIVDGIECFYPSFSAAQTERLIKLCEKNNLLITGGSDYHGAKRDSVIGGVELPGHYLSNVLKHLYIG